MKKVNSKSSAQKIARLLVTEGRLIDKILRLYNGDIITIARKVGRLHFAVSGRIKSLENPEKIRDEKNRQTTADCGQNQGWYF